MPGLFTIHHFGVDRKVQCPDFLRSTTLAWIVKSNARTFCDPPFWGGPYSLIHGLFTTLNFGVDRKVQCPDFLRSTPFAWIVKFNDGTSQSMTLVWIVK